jgi:hypothetical protein
MILTPAVLALLGGSALVCALAVVASVAGLSAVLGWDPDDSSPRQLVRERRSTLVEAALTLVLGCQLASLFLFVATAEHLHSLFTGAMCAAGTLNANAFGYPTLLIKLAVFGLCGLWLVVNRASAAAASTGLVRFKHAFLVLICGGLVAENVLQYRYFSGLDPEIITSCCATVFSDRAAGLGAELAALPASGCRNAFFAGLALTLAAGMRSLGGGRSPTPFAILSVPLGALSAAAVVSWIAPAFYQLPTHHCPFCLLSAEHHFVGYPLYATLSVAVVAGGGSGIVHRLRALDPFGCIRPGEERRLCVASMTSFVFFSLIALWPVVTTGYRVGGP